MKQVSDRLYDLVQELFDRLYASLPRRLRPEAVEPLLVGHRGVVGHPEFKENTLPAFDCAVRRGGALEFDLHLTRDRVAVVHHDRDLSRIHGVARGIAELSLDELMEVAPQVPTLREVLERYRGDCPRYFIEPKLYTESEGVDTLLELLRDTAEELGLTQRVTLLSLDPRPLDAARRIMPAVSKAYVYNVWPQPAVRYALSHGDTGIAGWYFSFPERFRRYLSGRGLLEGIGHVNYPSTLTAFRNRGFRYQFTNRIDRLVSEEH